MLMPERAGRRERIVVFAPHYAEYAMRLADALSRQADVLLLLDRANRQAECEDRFAGTASASLAIVEFRLRGRLARLLACGCLLTHVLRFRPTLINVQEEEGRFTAVVTGLLRRLAPIVLTVHDPNAHTGSDAAYLAANLAHRTAVRRSARAFHVHGRACREALRPQVGDRPILETQHAVLLVPEPRARRDPEPGRLLMFGRMEAYKGLAVLLAAADRLRQRGVAFTLVLAGRGPELTRLSDQLTGRPDLQVIDRFLSVEDAVEQFQRAAWVIVPYLDATQSGVVAAAFGNTRPVIASRIGGLADAVDDGVNGLLVPPGDVDALAQAIEDVLDGRVPLATLQAGAKRSAETTFAWPSIAGALLAFAEREGLTSVEARHASDAAIPPGP